MLDRAAGEYRCTLDGNEQYADVEGAVALWRRMAETRALARLCAATAFIEQPIKRQVALARPVDALASHPSPAFAVGAAMDCAAMARGPASPSGALLPAGAAA